MDSPPNQKRKKKGKRKKKKETHSFNGDKFEEEQISVEVSYLLSLSNFRWS
jgi:hypothetical protein